jgi:hypothetical protein
VPAALPAVLADLLREVTNVVPVGRSLDLDDLGSLSGEEVAECGTRQDETQFYNLDTVQQSHASHSREDRVVASPG